MGDESSLEKKKYTENEELKLDTQEKRQDFVENFYESLQFVRAETIKDNIHTEKYCDPYF